MQEDDLANILHNNFNNVDNKFLVLANKVNQMDCTTLNIAAEIAAMLASEAAQRREGL